MDPNIWRAITRRDEAVGFLMARKFPSLPSIKAIRHNGEWGIGVHQRGVTSEQRMGGSLPLGLDRIG